MRTLRAPALLSALVLVLAACSGSPGGSTADAQTLVGTRLATGARPHRSARPAEIHMGAVDTVYHPYTGEVMLRRRDVSVPERMPEFISFDTNQGAFTAPARVDVATGCGTLTITTRPGRSCPRGSRRRSCARSARPRPGRTP